MPKLDEYGDIPGQGGSQWATEDTVIAEHDPHIGRTSRGPKGTSFWMTAGRPESVSYEDWERYTQARWDRAFGKKEQHAAG